MSGSQPEGRDSGGFADSEHFVRMLPILEASLLLGVPTAHSAPSNRDDREPGSVLDLWATHFPNLGP